MKEESSDEGKVTKGRGWVRASRILVGMEQREIGTETGKTR